MEFYTSAINVFNNCCTYEQTDDNTDGDNGDGGDETEKQDEDTAMPSTSEP